jgi:hypothetical protein
MAGTYFISNSKIWVGVPERNGVVSVWDGEATRLRNGSIWLKLPWYQHLTGSS